MTDENDEISSFVTTNSDIPTAELPEQTDEHTDGDAEQTVQVDDATPSDTDATAETAEPKAKGKFQKRIDEVVRDREDEKRKSEALQRQLDELKSEQSTDKEPLESDFGTYDEYLDALDQFDTKQESDKPDKAKTDTDAQADITDSQKTAIALLREKISGASERFKDFDAVALDKEVPVTPVMAEALAECTDPAKVLYHLGNNKDFTAKLANQSPAKQAMAIAKLDRQSIKPVNNTNAPDPISPVHGSDSQQKPVQDMSFAEYEAHQNQREKKGGSGW